jgi:hypothetical protein
LLQSSQGHSGSWATIVSLALVDDQLIGSYHEERNALNGDVDHEKSEGADVVVDIQEGSSNVVGFNLLILVATVLHDQSLYCDSALALIQEPAFLRALWHEVWCAQADDNRNQTFKEKYVSPRVDDHARSTPRRDARKAENGSAQDESSEPSSNLHGSQETAESTGKGRCRDIYPNT